MMETQDRLGVGSLTAKTAGRQSLVVDGGMMGDRLEDLQDLGVPMTAQTTKFQKGKLSALTDRGEELKP